jgi:hypothetical protein
MPQKLTPEIIIAAIAGFEGQKALLDHQIAELRSMLDGGSRSEPAVSTATGKPRKKRSAAVRYRMKIAQQLRWKKIKEAAEPPQGEAAKPKKRKLSAAGRKAISIAAKKRWAALKSASAVAQKPGRKKGAAKKTLAQAAAE